MARAAFYVLLAVVFVVAASVCPAEAQVAKGAAAKAPAAQAQAGKGVPQRPNFNMVTGTIQKIDSSDPANVKIEVKGETDNQVHTVAVMPWTNVSKVTDVSELKNGEMVRVMSRNMDGKEVAMGILFGNIKAAPKPPPIPAMGAPKTAPVSAPKK